MDVNKMQRAMVTARINHEPEKLKVSDMATLLGMSDDLYRKKERGDVRFSYDELENTCVILGFSINDVNDIFFNGKLPNG